MAKLALIVVDMQVRFEGTSRKMNTIDNVVRVVKACHEKRIPVFFTQHHDPDGMDSSLGKWWRSPIFKQSDDWKLIDEIEQVCDRHTDRFIQEKATYDAFHGTSLKKDLLDLKVETVVVCGAMTNLCCETTARTAFVNDFNVIFLSDGNATSTQEFHDATIKNLEFGFATIKTSQEFIETLK